MSHERSTYSIPCPFCHRPMRPPHVVRIDHPMMAQLEVCERPACRQAAEDIRQIAETTRLIESRIQCMRASEFQALHHEIVGRENMRAFAQEVRR